MITTRHYDNGTSRTVAARYRYGGDLVKLNGTTAAPHDTIYRFVYPAFNADSIGAPPRNWSPLATTVFIVLKMTACC